MEFEKSKEGDETMSRVSRISKSISAMGKSDISRLSNKTYVSHLEVQLKEEREARLKLEQELEELKKISSEISSHLGLNKPK
mmetsp:Transcript_45559/g.33308  ORF Transcript_45559/g.33308 Transcript_45559/m.33308 type:complete len:82 (+) Transcript_45559:425-670(+)